MAKAKGWRSSRTSGPGIKIEENLLQLTTVHCDVCCCARVHRSNASLTTFGDLVAGRMIGTPAVNGRERPIADFASETGLITGDLSWVRSRHRRVSCPENRRHDRADAKGTQVSAGIWNLATLG